jgi:hypothetical protein
MAMEQARYEEVQAALEREAEVVTIDLARAEKLTNRVLVTHSAKLKVMLSELVIQTAEDLRSGDVKAKDRALALASLRSVCDRLYGWDSEPNIAEMQQARSGAINLALIRTSPEQTRQMKQMNVSKVIGRSAGQGSWSGCC